MAELDVLPVAASAPSGRRWRSCDGGTRLKLAGRISRLGNRLKDPEWRRYGALLFAGKMLGLAMLFLLVTVGPRLPDLLCGHAFAADTPATMPMPATTQAAAAATPDPYAAIPMADHINALNTVWTLVAAFLV